MTAYQYRVYLVVPDNRKDGLNQFIQEEFDDNDWLVVQLSATGETPATHWMTSFACTHSDTEKWATRLTTQGGVPLPPEFAGMDADQRIAFMEAASPTLKQLTGVVVRVCRNDGNWTLSGDDVLNAEGLKRVEMNG